jgi:hypothetical protein
MYYHHHCYKVGVIRATLLLVLLLLSGCSTLQLENITLVCLGICFRTSAEGKATKREEATCPPPSHPRKYLICPVLAPGPLGAYLPEPPASASAD